MARFWPLLSKHAELAGCGPASICKNSHTMRASHSLHMPSASHETITSPDFWKVQ